MTQVGQLSAEVLTAAIFGVLQLAINMIVLWQQRTLHFRQLRRTTLFLSIPLCLFRRLIPSQSQQPKEEDMLFK